MCSEAPRLSGPKPAFLAWYLSPVPLQAPESVSQCLSVSCLPVPLQLSVHHKRSPLTPAPAKWLLLSRPFQQFRQFQGFPLWSSLPDHPFQKAQLQHARHTQAVGLSPLFSRPNCRLLGEQTAVQSLCLHLLIKTICHSTKDVLPRRPNLFKNRAVFGLWSSAAPVEQWVGSGRKNWRILSHNFLNNFLPHR